MGKLPDPDTRLLSEARSLSRRAMIQRAAAGIAAGVPLTSGPAQGSTPVSGTPLPVGTRSITRAEYLAAIRQHFAFEPPQVMGGHLLPALGDEIQTLNPIVATDGFTGTVIRNLFSALAQPSVIDGSWAPELADYWEISADGTAYLFHLNPGATWHDGLPVTAQDCAFTLDAVLDESGLSSVRSDVAKVVKNYRAIDDHTFELVAQEPTAVLLDKSVGALAILPRHIWGPTPYDEWGSAPGATGADPSQVVGSGPFRFGDWARGDHVSIVGNDAYWEPELAPIIDRCTWRILPNEETALQSLLAGEIDISSVPVGHYQTLRESHPDLTYTMYDDIAFTYYALNGDPERAPFFVDHRVRQAMLYALDRDLIVATILDGFGVRADGIYPPPSRWYAPDRLTTIYVYDPDRARSLLDEAGWIDADGEGIRAKDGETFQAKILFPEGGPFSRQIVTYLQQAWREIGVDIQPTSVEFPIMLDRLTTGDFQASLLGFGVGVGEDLGSLYRCDAMPPTGFNLQRICNPEFDRLNDASLFELDPARRRELLIEQGNVANDNALLGLLYFSKSVIAAQPRVKNYFSNAYGLDWSLPWVWLAAEN